MPTGQCILNEDIHLESPKDFWSPYRLVCLSFLLSYMGNLDLSCSFGVTATGKAVGMSRFFLFSFSVPNQDSIAGVRQTQSSWRAGGPARLRTFSIQIVRC